MEHIQGSSFVSNRGSNKINTDTNTKLFGLVLIVSNKHQHGSLLEGVVVEHVQRFLLRENQAIERLLGLAAPRDLLVEVLQVLLADRTADQHHQNKQHTRDMNSTNHQICFVRKKRKAGKWRNLYRQSKFNKNRQP